MLVNEQQGGDSLDLTIFEAMPGNYLLLSPKLQILAASEAYLQLAGKTREALTGAYLFDVFPEADQWMPEQYEGIAQSLKKVVVTGQVDELPVMRFDTPDERGGLQERYWKTVNKPVNGNDGQVQYIIHHTAEVTIETLKERQVHEALATERKAAGAQLKAEQMERLFHDIPAQIAIVRGPDLIYDYINPQYQRELFPGREVLGMPLLEALPEVKDQPIWDVLQTVYQSGKPHIQNEMRIPLAPHKGAALNDHYFNLVYQPLFNEAGDVYAILSFKYEITSHVAARQAVEFSALELTSANKRLNEYITELQALHEELQSSNEELVSSNELLLLTQGQLNSLNISLEARIAERTRELEESFEEQQVLNEEISAANEEMAAANEELTATNEKLNETQEELQHTLRGLSESEQRFRNLVRDATVGIILLTGTDLQVSIVNDFYGSLIGRTAAELDKRRLFDVIPEAEAVFRPVIERVRDSGKPLYLYDQPYLVYKDERTIEGFLNLIYQPYREADGRISGVMVLCQDVTSQVMARHELENNEARFRFLLNAMPQQVWTATPDGALDYVNQVVAVDFGHTMESVVAHGWQEFVHPDDLPGASDKWIKALQNGSEYLTEFRLKFADGNYCWHLARAVPLVEDGKVMLWLGTNTNIHAQKNNEYKKDEFLSIASHELKTPLTTIKAFFQLAKKDAGEHKILGQFADRAERQLVRLGRLIDDLLDVSKINAGKMVYNMEGFDFTQALADTVESIQQTTSRHRIELITNCSLLYHGDRHRIEQVLINLLNNAIKYSPEADRIIVSCEADQQSLIVSVQDFGIGIAAEHIKGLFDRYYRVDNTAMRFEGLGLGLYISSEILKRHQGSFWIDSQQGQGSTFYFRLPVNGVAPVVRIIQEAGFYQDQHLTIRHNAGKRRLNVDWTGFQDMDSVQKGCLRMLEYLQRHQVDRIVNDNTHVQGNWADAVDWVGNTWFPMMEQAGLKYFAHIFSPSIFSQLAAQKSIDIMAGIITTQYFTDIDLAEAWVDLQK